MLKFLILLIVIALPNLEGKKYTPDWKSLDSRPLPDWYDKAKIGIFMHSGVYSVPGFYDEWFWMRTTRKGSSSQKFMEENYRPGFTYQDFGPQLKFEFFDPNQFAELVQNAGAKYFVITSKHHDGFTNFNSKHTFGWNSVDIGPKRDILMELKNAFNKTDVKFGLYHSLFEWFNPMYLSDKANHYKTQVYVETKMKPEFKSMVQTYEPHVIWSDGDWEATPEYWDSKEIMAWLFNEAPTKDTIVVNDRWGKGTREKHGSYWSGPDRFNPGKLLPHKWEDAMTVDKHSWGYRRDINIGDVMSPYELITLIVEVVSCGGNMLINVGPTKEGTICPMFQERMAQMGAWLGSNGKAIYETKPWSHQKETIVDGSNKFTAWYTSRPDLKEVYAILTGWPIETSYVDLALPKVGKNTVVNMFCYDKPLTFSQVNDKVRIELPDLKHIKAKCGAGGDWAFAITLQNLENN